MKKIIDLLKVYFEDYADAQKKCNEFQRKHWKGNLVFTLIVWLLSFFGIKWWIERDERRRKSYDDILMDDED